MTVTHEPHGLTNEDDDDLPTHFHGRAIKTDPGELNFPEDPTRGMMQREYAPINGLVHVLLNENVKIFEIGNTDLRVTYTAQTGELKADFTPDNKMGRKNTDREWTDLVSKTFLFGVNAFLLYLKENPESIDSIISNQYDGQEIKLINQTNYFFKLFLESLFARFNHADMIESKKIVLHATVNDEQVEHPDDVSRWEVSFNCQQLLALPENDALLKFLREVSKRSSKMQVNGMRIFNQNP